VRIAVAPIVEHRFAVGARPFLEFEPDLADAAANLVGVIMGGLAKRFERTAQLQDIAIAVFPIVEEGKVAADRIDAGQFGRPSARVALLYRASSPGRQSAIRNQPLGFGGRPRHGAAKSAALSELAEGRAALAGAPARGRIGSSAGESMAPAAALRIARHEAAFSAHLALAAVAAFAMTALRVSSTARLISPPSSGMCA
jgi:hypothetical protein